MKLFLAQPLLWNCKLSHSSWDEFIFLSLFKDYPANSSCFNSVQGSSLLSYLTEQDFYMEYSVATLMTQLFQALDHIHGLEIAHLDIEVNRGIQFIPNPSYSGTLSINNI